MRAQGLANLSEVRAVVLESDGSISVVHGNDRPLYSAAIRAGGTA